MLLKRKIPGKQRRCNLKCLYPTDLSLPFPAEEQSQPIEGGKKKNHFDDNVEAKVNPH